jgi:hypothetical protein
LFLVFCFVGFSGIWISHLLDRSIYLCKYNANKYKGYSHFLVCYVVQSSCMHAEFPSVSSYSPLMGVSYIPNCTLMMNNASTIHGLKSLLPIYILSPLWWVKIEFNSPSQTKSLYPHPHSHLPSPRWGSGLVWFVES